MSTAPLTAKGSVPPRPGNAFDLYKEKLIELGKFMVQDTSPAVVKELWKQLSEQEKKQLALEAKGRRDAFDKQYPNWRKKAPKNKEVAVRLEELRSSAQLPRVAPKMSLSAGMPVATQEPAPRVFYPVRRVAVVPQPQPHHHHQRAQTPGVFRVGRAPPQYGAYHQRPELQEAEQQENPVPSTSFYPVRRMAMVPPPQAHSWAQNPPQYGAYHQHWELQEVELQENQEPLRMYIPQAQYRYNPY
ncbi:hypothetical protein CAEBREN_21701 [Caenorhabditis brenneri]|uniref:HMG box domain-containing protein n=1 Tax=Caenorhabditis brenneri TaxID=135651 RepID=G0N1B3_CAEBE|nr:hypothetical protein CAEBREN_21701 [Caenorhabditis brenneri]